MNTENSPTYLRFQDASVLSRILQQTQRIQEGTSTRAEALPAGGQFIGDVSELPPECKLVNQFRAPQFPVQKADDGPKAKLRAFDLRPVLVHKKLQRQLSSCVSSVGR